MPSEKIVAIIQARLGSTRLPLKSLLSLNGLPVISWVTRRVARAKHLTGLVVAIPDTSSDHVLANHLERSSIPWIAGPENDVLSRFVKAAEATSADYIVRICADNPLVWWEAIDRLIDFYLHNRPDYAYNHIPLRNSWPDGLGAEILSAPLLKEIAEKANMPAQREHCLNYIWDNQGKYRIATFNPEEQWLWQPQLKLDIDTKEDFLKLAKRNIHPESTPEEIIREFNIQRVDQE